MLSALLDLALPRLCVGCRRPDRLAFCPRCRPIGPTLLSDALGFPLAAAGDYDGTLRTALLAYKERDRRDLARALGGLLGDTVSALPVAAPVDSPVDAPVDAPVDVPVLVPVPSNRAARRRRGGDHVVRLARQCGRPVRTPLRLGRTVLDSAGLDVEARQANLGGAMRAHAPDGPASAVLVDDIATTGATLTEAARALTEAGWSVAGAAVIAVTARRDGPDRWRVTSHGSSVGAT